MTANKETYRLAFPDHPNPPYTHVSYGLPFTDSCAKHVSETFHSKRAYIVASTSLSKQTSYVKDLENALGPNHGGTWVGIRPHTPWDDLVPIINDMMDKKSDCLITLGGGSLTDGAKIIIYAIANGLRTVTDLETMAAHARAERTERGAYFRDSSGDKSPTIPIICIPTTLSGGEYSRFGGATSSTTHLKTVITHEKMYPSIVILDPHLTLTTPTWVWLSTGVRGVDHCVEGLCSLQPLAPADLAIVRSDTSRALSLLVPSLLASKSDPSNLEARLNCQIAINLVLVQLLYAPKILLPGASHGIGHQLGPLGVGHGQTSCIMLPAVMRYNKRVNADRQQLVQNILWGEQNVAKLLEDAGLNRDSSDAADALDIIFRALGMPRSLAEVGIGRDKLDILATNSLDDNCSASNPIPLTKKEQVLEILEMVVGD